MSNDIALKLKFTNHELQITNHEPRITNNDILELYSISKDNDKQKFLGGVKKNERLQLGPINIGYFGTQTLTGLQFKSNPGGILIYPGLFLIISGVLIAFGSRRQIWATINTTNNKIIIGGSSDRAKRKFFEEFEKLISDISLKK